MLPNYLLSNLNLEVTTLQQLLSTAQERIEDSELQANGLPYRLSIALNKLADSNQRWVPADLAATTHPPQDDWQSLI
jgi:hypothetical protein